MKPLWSPKRQDLQKCGELDFLDSIQSNKGIKNVLRVMYQSDKTIKSVASVNFTLRTRQQRRQQHADELLCIKASGASEIWQAIFS